MISVLEFEFLYYTEIKACFDLLQNI